MKPDQQSNYWQHDESEETQAPSDYPTEMYEPTELHDTPTAQQGVEQFAGLSNVAPAEEEPVHWQAPEYVHLDKGAWWFVLFAVVVAALVAVDVFLLKSWTFSALVIVMAVALIVYIRRPPRDIHYTLSGAQGLYIGEKLYHLNEFKSFGLIKDGDRNSIMLIPTKRFSPGVSVYFPKEAGEKIVDILGARLPMEKLKLDAVDVLVRKLRL